ncbi:MAG: hypothetical protein P2A85_01950 [Microcoleus anatoxicus]
MASGLQIIDESDSRGDDVVLLSNFYNYILMLDEVRSDSVGVRG